MASKAKETAIKASDLNLLMDRPGEPTFLPKGENAVTIEIPSEYYTDRYKPLEDSLSNRFGTEDKIVIKKITLPDLSFPLQLGRKENFSLFIPSHHRMAASLITTFMGMRTLEDFMSVAVFARDRINPYMFMYAMSVAILHRKDTKNIRVPSFHEIFPEKYIDGELFSRAREESNIVPQQQRLPLEIPVDYTASDLEFEHRVAYFREDLGINLHHWHWHLVYPFDAPMEVVNKDRRGELFYYMHQQVMARYNFERFCNNLGRTKRLLNWEEPIVEGYFPKLDSLVASRVWPARVANTRLSDVNREVDQIKFDIQDLERWRDRIFAAIHSGSIVDAQGQTVQLTESRGIDVLGNMIEASIISPNRNVYGDLHNLGHVAIALSHDPDHRHLETFGVMGDTATAMRDPVFYRWHATIDDIFMEHKNTLPRYTTQQLDYSGVTVTAVEVTPNGGQKNRLTTFWQQSDVDLSRGLDFTPRGSIFARFTHLQHTPYTYKIQVNNTGAQRQGTCRIFIAPRLDERGLPFLFRDQKNLFVELDKFTVNLKAGANTIERKSFDSSVTIPFDRTFRNLEGGRPSDNNSQEKEIRYEISRHRPPSKVIFSWDGEKINHKLNLEGGRPNDDNSQTGQAFNFCGCGWPQHMLIPKGARGGFPCQLFVMISNFQDDRVDTASGSSCSDAASYCGIRDALYPDKRSMGYPFDRLPRQGAETLRQFMTRNMFVTDINIDFNNRTVRPKTPGANTQPNTLPK